MYGQVVYERIERDKIIAEVERRLADIVAFIESDPEYATAVKSALKAKHQKNESDINMLAQLALSQQNFMSQLNYAQARNDVSSLSAGLCQQAFGRFW